jgi:hypothetical protein
MAPIHLSGVTIFSGIPSKINQFPCFAVPLFSGRIWIVKRTWVLDDSGLGH